MTTRDYERGYLFSQIGAETKFTANLKKLPMAHFCSSGLKRYVSWRGNMALVYPR
jgi:hypothetical protein